VGLIPVAAAWAPATESETLRSLDPAALFDSIAAFRDWIMPRVSVHPGSRAG
jgi:hypothetical protein